MASSKSRRVSPPPRKLNPALNLKARVQLQRELLANVPTKPVDSPHFKMSFKYCLVDVERPWFFEPLLREASWRVPGYMAGAFASGSTDNMAGLMPAIPIAFLAIKDLVISAAWSSDDAKAITDKIGLGPFSLTGSTFANNTLSCQGVQIIGWICETMPLLPPH